MGILDYLADPFAEAIDWVEQPGELAVRRPLSGRALRRGARLTVREGQTALFHADGRLLEAFGPGVHDVGAAELPLLTALLPIDPDVAADLYFYTTTEQIGLTWGTSQPVVVRDPVLGSVGLRAFGRYAFRIGDVAVFAVKLMGTRGRLVVADVEPLLRAAIAAELATGLGESGVAVADIAGDQDALSRRLRDAVEPAFAALGLECTAFFVESVTLPEETDGRPAAADPIAAIAALHQLRVAGVLTQAEFDGKKAMLLARIG